MDLVVMGDNNPMMVEYYQYKVEFQERGAGHIHGTLWLKLDMMERLIRTDGGHLVLTDQDTETPGTDAEAKGDDKDETDFDKLVKLYHQSVNINTSSTVTPELEVKFGTKGNRPLNRNDYDNVIKKLKSNGFRYLDNKTSYFLRMQSEYTNKSGFKRMSSNRIEINDLKAIQMYCKTNNLKQLYENNPTTLLFIEKSLYSVDKSSVVN